MQDTLRQIFMHAVRKVDLPAVELLGVLCPGTAHLPSVASLAVRCDGGKQLMLAAAWAAGLELAIVHCSGHGTEVACASLRRWATQQCGLSPQPDVRALLGRQKPPLVSAQRHPYWEACR